MFTWVGVNVLYPGALEPVYSIPNGKLCVPWL